MQTTALLMAYMSVIVGDGYLECPPPELGSGG